MQELDQTLGELVSALEAGAEDGFKEEHRDRFHQLLASLPPDLPPEHRDFVTFLENDWEERRSELARRGPAPSKGSRSASGDEMDVREEGLAELLASLRALPEDSPSVFRDLALGDGLTSDLAAPPEVAQKRAHSSVRFPLPTTPDGWARRAGYKTVEDALRAQKAREQQLLEQQGRKLPLRYSGRDVPGHVEHCRKMNGLVHGGTITTRWYTLQCRAFLSSGLEQNDHGRKGSVGGCTEQRGLDGELMTRWSTALKARKYHNDLTRSAPQAFSFYYSNHSFPFDALLRQKTGEAVHDSGVPFASYRSRPRALWNPLCVPEMSEKSRHMPIVSPYVKVFSPGPDVRTTIVAMVGAYWELRGGHPFSRAQWEVKTFS